MNKQIALIGNQNCGKTTLFNHLTGSSQHVGNFPGVTVERKRGFIKGIHQTLELIDLPGIYSLSAYTMEETVSIQYLLNEKPQLIINIVDATHLERSLYLTLQLIEFNIPMILVLNMMDEVISNGHCIHIEKLQQSLGISVIPMSASQNRGIKELLLEIDKINEHDIHHLDLCTPLMQPIISSLSEIIQENASKYHLPLRYCVTQLIEGDQNILHKLHLSQQENSKIEHIIKTMEQEQGYDRETIMIHMRYVLIDQIVEKCIDSYRKTQEQQRSQKIDHFLTHRYLGIPLFILIMISVFYITFDLLGTPIQNYMNQWINDINTRIFLLLKEYQVAEWVCALIHDGIFVGVGSVLSFLPVIIILFFFLSLLEDSGYMARVAFIMDKPLRKLGLSGRSFVPMLMGFGCSVPAIMATRTLSSKRDRYLTITLTPFMSCSAKLPIYSMMVTAFFPEKTALVFITIYSIGIFTAILSSLLLKNTLFVGEEMPFLLELPTYRFPTYQNIYLNVWSKAKDFVTKAFTVILLGSILIWFLQNFNLSLEMVERSQESILADIGQKLSFLFEPLGFDDWRAVTAIITGITAKENVVSTLSILTIASDTISLNNALKMIFTPLTALSFLVFIALYTPCIAAFMTTKREVNSWKQAILISFFQTMMAYMTSFLIYQLGKTFF